jgi:hypothetical protein
MHFLPRPKFKRSFKVIPIFESAVQIAGRQKAAVSLSQQLRKGLATILVTSPERTNAATNRGV